MSSRADRLLAVRWLNAGVTEEKGGSAMLPRLASFGLSSVIPLLLLVLFGVSASAQQAPAPIQIAWAGPLTGDVAQLGQGYLNGVKLAFDEWNAKGGVLGRKLVVAPEDDGCDPKQASTVATKIADDTKNVALIGHFCSGTTLAGAPIHAKVNLPMLTLSSNPKITQQGWKNLVRPVANDSVQGKAGVTFVMRKLGAKRVAMLNDKQAFGQGVTEVAKATVEKAGGTVTSYGGVEPKDVDYSAVLTKIIRTENADAILYCTNFNTSAGLMVKQIRQLGFKKPVIGCDGYFDPGMVKAAGVAANQVSDAEALYFTFQAPPYAGAEAPEAVKQFAAKYKGKYGNDPNGYEVYGYDIGNIVAAAIQKAGAADRQKIIEALHKQGIPGVLIPEYRFDENGDVVNGPLYIYTIDKGAFKLVEQFKE
jgi:branched-chain amino acid transport system substrate-binding protein